MTLNFVLSFLIILVAMLASGTFGYLLARTRTTQSNAQQISLMSAEILRMRRRAGSAEGVAEQATARLTRERRKHRRR